MRKYLPLFVFSAGTFFFTTSTTSAQQTDRFAYAITDVQPTGANWSYLRKINLVTGEFSPVLLNGNDINFVAYDAATKTPLAAPLKDPLYGQLKNAPFGNGVAAVAFDKKSNRLYFTPMFFDQLRYLDLKTMNIFYVTDKVLTGHATKSADQGNIVTRMTIGKNGFGYALSNDGKDFVRFATGKSGKIEYLGSLVDDPANNGISIYNSCTSFGGDMIADDAGYLFVISARNHVFKINIESKVATHIGVVTGLPEQYTINGMAVNDQNQIIVSSAMQSKLFAVNYQNWNATPVATKGQVWNVADLANSNLLVTSAKSKAIPEFAKTIPANNSTAKASIYPNPVSNNQFVIQFNELEAGNYTLQVTDVMGRQAKQKQVALSEENQAQTIKLSPAAAKGIYLVQVINQQSQIVFNTKIVVQ